MCHCQRSAGDHPNQRIGDGPPDLFDLNNAVLRFGRRERIAQSFKKSTPGLFNGCCDGVVNNLLTNGNRGSRFGNHLGHPGRLRYSGKRGKYPVYLSFNLLIGAPAEFALLFGNVLNIYVAVQQQAVYLVQDQQLTLHGGYLGQRIEHKSHPVQGFFVQVVVFRSGVLNKPGTEPFGFIQQRYSIAYEQAAFQYFFLAVVRLEKKGINALIHVPSGTCRKGHKQHITDHYFYPEACIWFHTTKVIKILCK